MSHHISHVFSRFFPGFSSIFRGLKLQISGSRTTAGRPRAPPFGARHQGGVVAQDGSTLVSLDWFVGENLHRKPWFLHVFTIKLIGLSGENFPIIQFYDGAFDDGYHGDMDVVKTLWFTIGKWWFSMVHNGEFHGMIMGNMVGNGCVWKCCVPHCTQWF